MESLATELNDDTLPDVSLRPQRLSDFTGQPEIVKHLGVSLDAAKKLAIPLDHVLIYGPPGLGKTTLARVIANELGASFKSIAAPSISRPGDLVSALVAMEESDRNVLFIDEIHRLHPAIEEVLYTAMEDFRLDIIVGEPGNTNAITIDLPPFTLVGATTRQGMLSNPLRDRFGIMAQLSLYGIDDLVGVVTRASRHLGISIDAEAALTIAKSARGTPRIAINLLKRVRDHVVHENREVIDPETTRSALASLGIDERGLDRNDRRYLDYLKNRFRGGPVGIETLSAVLGESRETVECSIEPFLMQEGYIERTPRGRVISETLSLL